MIVEFRFNSKSSGQNVPEAIRIAERCGGYIEDRFYKVKFKDPQDRDLKKLFDLVGKLKGTAIILDDEEPVVARKFLNAVNCSEKLLCKGTCRHVKFGYYIIDNFLDEHSENIENDIFITSQQGLIRILTQFLEQIEENRFRLNKKLFLEHFIQQTEMENRFCIKFNINKAQREIENLPNEIKLVSSISVKPFFELHLSVEDLLDGIQVVDGKYNNNKKTTEKSLEDLQRETILTQSEISSKLEKELRLKGAEILNLKSDEELAEMLFEKVKTQIDLSSINLGVYWSEMGVDNIFNFPQSTYYRWEKINNIVWQKVKVLKKQRKNERVEKERLESFKLIDEIIEWVKEKGFKKLSKINLKLYLSEKKIDLVTVNRQALYLEVNRRLKLNEI